MTALFVLAELVYSNSLSEFDLKKLLMPLFRIRRSRVLGVDDVQGGLEIAREISEHICAIKGLLERPQYVSDAFFRG